MQIAHATTITVMNLNDSGPGSLRQALSDANDGDTIDFSVTTPATITLSAGELGVVKSITIAGPGAANLTVDGNHASRVFEITSNSTVTISGLTITNGSVSGSPGGGGIYNNGAVLTVSNCTISGNSADFGGGISNNATLAISNSTLSGNSAANFGGGIYNTAELTISNSTLSGNSASFGGGGICTFSGLTISNSTQR